MSNKKILLSVSEELRKALLECDVNKLEEIISDDYQGFSLNGTVENKEIILQNFKPGCVNLTKYVTKDIQCEVINNLGIISGKGSIVGNYGKHIFQHEVLFTDIYKFVNDKWQFYRSQVTEIKSA